MLDNFDTRGDEESRGEDRPPRGGGKLSGVSRSPRSGPVQTGVDFISVGALTHSVKALDISLELSQTARGRAH